MLNFTSIPFCVKGIRTIPIIVLGFFQKNNRNQLISLTLNISLCLTLSLSQRQAPQPSPTQRRRRTRIFLQHSLESGIVVANRVSIVVSIRWPQTAADIFPYPRKLQSTFSKYRKCIFRVAHARQFFKKYFFPLLIRHEKGV